MPTFERKEKITGEFKKIAPVGRVTPLSPEEEAYIKELKLELTVEKIINSETKNVIDLSGEGPGRRIDLQGIDFRIIFKPGELRGANLGRTNLQWVNLAGVDFSDADLQWVNFGYNLRGANLRGANLGWANLEEANLMRANLFKVDFTHAIYKPKISNLTVCLNLQNVPNTDNFTELRAQQPKCEEMFRAIINISELNGTALYAFARGFKELPCGEGDPFKATSTLFGIRLKNPELFDSLLNIRRKQIENNPTLKSICDAHKTSSSSYREHLESERATKRARVENSIQ